MSSPRRGDPAAPERPPVRYDARPVPDRKAADDAPAPSSDPTSSSPIDEAVDEVLDDATKDPQKTAAKRPTSRTGKRPAKRPAKKPAKKASKRPVRTARQAVRKATRIPTATPIGLIVASLGLIALWSFLMHARQFAGFIGGVQRGIAWLGDPTKTIPFKEQ